MTLLERFKLDFPFLRIPQKCESCGLSFACEIGLKGCWCSQVKLSKAARQALRAKYRRCLCRACLEKAGTETLNV